MSDLKPESVPENKKGFTINASPLNPVKLELGAIIIAGVLLLVSMEFIALSLAMQFLLLVSYGLISMGWLLFRARRIVKKHREQVNG